jgi:hypothetical protein
MWATKRRGRYPYPYSQRAVVLPVFLTELAAQALAGDQRDAVPPAAVVAAGDGCGEDTPASRSEPSPRP